jgi:hypothetical protein
MRAYAPDHFAALRPLDDIAADFHAPRWPGLVRVAFILAINVVGWGGIAFFAVTLAAVLHH